MLLVTVHACVGRRQPVYYLNDASLEAWIRRAESLHRMDASLIMQREAEWSDAMGRPHARTWRNLVHRAIPFDQHIETLLEGQAAHGGGAKVARVWQGERRPNRAHRTPRAPSSPLARHAESIPPPPHPF